MKISKVNNTRTGIGVNDSRSTGIIYVTPNKPDARKDIETHIKHLNEKAQKLYSPFNSSSIIMKCEAYRRKSRNEKQLCKEAENAIKKGSRDFACDIARKTTYVRKAIENSLQTQSIVGKYSCIDEEFCQTIINVSLKKSLRKSLKHGGKRYPLKDIMTKVVMIIANLIPVSELTEQESVVLYEALYEDYNKEKQIKRWVKSFGNKNTKVQVLDVNGESRLELSSIVNAKKKYISDFIHDYAGNSEKEKKELLIHQRRLLLLYVCGVNAYRAAEHLDLMTDNWGGLLPEDGENISEEIYQCILSEEDALTVNDYDKMRMEHYGQAVRVEGLSDNDKKWIGYFNDEVGKIFEKRKNRNNPIKVGSKYILKYLWKRWTSFIAMKYIDIGKAVYHFAMPKGIDLTDGKTVEYGVVQEEFRNGISSFDYERIKAKESIGRDLAVYTTFAANIFSRATVEESYLEKKNKEDVLSYNESDLKNGALKSNTKRRILQYFGGMSRWEKNENEIISINDNELFMAMLQEIRIARNVNYHYSTLVSDDNKVEPVIAKMFRFELENAGTHFRKKYYSNNTLMFYSKTQIDQFMNRLYKEPVRREPQIPAFGNVFKKADCKSFVTQFVPGNKRASLYEGLDEFYATFYFMAKEIYYYDFLQLPDLKERFLAAFESVNEEEIKAVEATVASKGNKKKEAKKNFREYLDRYCKEMSFGELCQCVMTEYNQQNQNFKEVRTRVEKEKNKEIYQHFRMLLYAALKVAFEKYIKESGEYQFLKTPNYLPKIAEKISEGDFCKNFSVGLFRDIENVENQNVYSWYVIAHFITAKQLNHLQGAIKNYLQYSKDIERRAESTRNKVIKISEQEQQYYEMLLKIFSVVLLQSGQISHEFKDYFDDEDEYAKYLAKYVKYTNDEPSVALLKAFCDEDIIDTKKKEKGQKKSKGNGLGDLQAIFAGKKEQKTNETQKIGIYCDDMHPILNKNIIYSKLFGFEKQISDIFTVTRKDIENYYTLKKSLDDTFKKEQCTTADEQKMLRQYQDIKNKVELYDVTTYTEVMIDCMAQLVSYAYLRERDNMYMQLGYHYVHLYYGKDVQENENTLLNISKGAILYQIYAMYNYDAAIIIREGKQYKWEKNGQMGVKIEKFVNCYSTCRYFDGMYFFENISMHDVISKRRNYIDHMKYLSKQDTSILEMYGWMYNGFFDYDIKLKKSMSFILNNILMKYFVGIELKTERAEHKYQVQKSQYVNTREKKELVLTETRFKILSVISEQFIYKKLHVQEGNKSKPLEIDARNKQFRATVKSLLEMYGKEEA